MERFVQKGFDRADIVRDLRLDLIRRWRTTKHENKRAFNSFKYVVWMLAISDV
jgi:hypothetical protein